MPVRGEGCDDGGDVGAESAPIELERRVRLLEVATGEPQHVVAGREVGRVDAAADGGLGSGEERPAEEGVDHRSPFSSDGRQVAGRLEP